MCGGRKRPHGWKAMLLRSTFIDQSVISMDQSVRPFPRIPAKPNPGRPVAIHDLSFRKFQKLGRLTSFAVVSLIETSFPFYEWYKLRLFSFNTITVNHLYIQRRREGGWFRWSVVRDTPINKIIIDTLLKVLPHTLCKTKKFKGLLPHSEITIVWIVVVFHCSAIINTKTIKCFYCEKKTYSSWRWRTIFVSNT